jgi:methylglutaconyl-CoA hydratase
MTLRVDVNDAVARVTLARPQVHNAFDDALIAALTEALRELDADAGVRVVVLQGEGRSFCAGADLDWMRRTATYDEAQNLADARDLAALLATLDDVPRPVIARVQGNAFGGGVGLCACCDIAVAADDARFALSEVRLGLIPATIGPYVVRAIGARAARRWFLTGERFDAREAHRMGLVHEIVPPDALDARVDALVAALLEAGPQAQAEAKRLVRRVAQGPIDAAMIDDTARHIARVRAGPEGREGIAAFLAKRAPAWRTPGTKDE